MNLKLAVRLLWKTPFVTLVAILSLALGIGANAAIFSLFDQMLIRPLPVPNPGRLVNFSNPGPKPGSQSCGQAGDCTEVFSYPMYLDLAREQTSFTGIAAHVSFGANIGAKDRTIAGRGMFVSGNYFSVLELRPALGRLLEPQDAQAQGLSPVAVLGYDYWRTAMGADPGVLNQPIIVNGQTLTIVGVAPPGFSSTTVGLRPQVFVPITMRPVLQVGSDSLTRRRSYWAYLFGRLKPGVTVAQASSALSVPYHAILANVEAPLQQGMSEKTLAAFKEKKLVLTPGPQGQSNAEHEARTPLTLLLGITALVLVIACANIANLLLARGASRSAEMAVRLSIGGTRWQLIRQLLTESVLLGLVGGALGLAVARATLGGMLSILPPDATSMFYVHLDWQIIAFTAALSIVTALLFGLFPALYATRPDLISSLREQGGQLGGGRAASRWRTTLATTQVALAMALLASAGLFARSLAKVSRVDLGVKIDHVVTFGVAPVLNGYTPARSQQFFHQLEEQLRQLPGVVSVSAARVPLIAGNNWGNDVDIQGYDPGPDSDLNSRFNEVGTDYFRTVGIPLIAGREFTAADVQGAAQVAIVNETFARKFHLGANPVGHRMDQGNKKYDIEIVGLVKDAKYSDVKDEIPPVFFLPYAQDDGIGEMSFYVKTTLDPTLILSNIPKVVAGLDRNLPVIDLMTMPEQIKQNIFLDRFISIFSGIFALLATILAAIGLYGVLAYTVAQRTREIGVRMALGAQPGQVRLMILRQVGRMTAIGSVIGLAAAVALGRAMGSMLYQMKGWDPLVLIGALVALSAVALTAGLAPAHRAAQLDPVKALRWE